MPKALFLIALLGFAAPVSAEPYVRFDGEVYKLAWSTKENKVELSEFLRPDESLSSWSQMISIQTHRRASRVFKVMNPYTDARKSLFVVEPKSFSKTDSPYAEDYLFQLVLRAPDNSFVEFVLVRAFSNKRRPVTLVIFSKRIPKEAEKEGMAEVDRRIYDWYREVLQVTVQEDTSKAEALDASPDRAELLTVLRARLARLATAPPDEALWVGGDLDLSPLVGAAPDGVRAALGEPSYCTGATARDSAAIPGRFPSCPPGGNPVYRFYRLPERSLGGGPELRLALDETGRCTAADWVFTQ